MKKITLIASAALLIGATSCNDNKQSFKSTSSFKLESYTLVTGANVDPTVSLTEYAFETDNYNFTLKMSSNNLVIGGSAVDFATGEMPMVYGVIRMKGAKEYSSFYLSESKSAGNVGSMPITDVFADFTTCSNTYNDSIVNLLADQLKLNPIVYPRTRIYSETQFKVGDFLVRTFWKDMLFTGTTNVAGGGLDTPTTANKPSYRVLMNLETPGSYKADVFMYNISFLGGENTVNYVVKGVPVRFDNNGFVIECSDVTPEAIALKTDQKAPAIKLSTLNIRSSSHDLTQAECRYQIEGSYTCSFSGTCLMGFNMSDMKDK